MSQATASAPPPATAPQGAPTSAPVATGELAPPQVQSSPSASTPVLLARYRAITVVLIALLSALTTAGLVREVVQSGRAVSDTEQLIRAQGIKTSLLRADALATNAFLVGGLEPSEQRRAYDDALAAAVSDTARAAAAQSADTEVLTSLSTKITSYASLMEQARANNRQGKPVGAAYLRQASTELRAEAIPIIDAVISANKERSRDALSVLPAIVVLLGAILVAVWLVRANSLIARRFHRRINVGLAAAGVLVLAGSLWAAGTLYQREATNGQLIDGAYSRAVGAAELRSAANDARSYESLRLIERGSGEKWESPWRTAADTVEATRTSAGLTIPWGDYASEHAAVVKADADGDWNAAVEASVGAAAEAFARVDTAAETLISEQSEEIRGSLAGSENGLLIAAALAALTGIIAVVAAWRGIGARLKEYS